MKKKSGSDKTWIAEFLERGVAEVIGREDLEAKIRSGKTLRVKLGIDPTSPHIHIGRTVSLLKLRDLQKHGHKIIFIVGDFTGVIGDTSDKESERPMLSTAEVKKNMKTYFDQAGKIIDLEKTETKKNSSWLGKLRYGDIGKHADVFSVADFTARENIKRRMDKGLRVSLRELLYPLMQGYDSVAVRADLEIGGTDQRFNMLAGRALQNSLGQKPQAVMAMNLIPGTDGRKMSSSWGNTINVTDTPNDMYGKVMSVSDDMMIPYFISVTRMPIREVETMGKKMKEGTLNPRDVKMRLAREITTLFHGEKKASGAELVFVQTFQKKEVPDNIGEYKVEPKETIEDVLMASGLCASRTQARRLAEGGAVKDAETGETIRNLRISAKKMTLKVGKRRFLRLV